MKSKGSNKNINVSITIPVYHAEKRLPSLVASRLKENRSNVELNSVNDRSTGQTISVINRIRDDRIILVELANKSVYAARNLALTMHRGD
ncbi:glycosyltransferase [Atlantibacter sp.]|uniref:glycosyltransferase n=1 Tax=Atlantibacter sp. TaxID=1903473 RepID=UPI0039183410